MISLSVIRARDGRGTRGQRTEQGWTLGTFSVLGPIRGKGAPRCILVALNSVPVNVDSYFARFRVCLSVNLFLVMALFVPKRSLQEITVAWFRFDMNLVNVGVIPSCVPCRREKPVAEKSKRECPEQK